jgi:signal transduction histidine kinase
MKKASTSQRDTSDPKMTGASGRVDYTQMTNAELSKQLRFLLLRSAPETMGIERVSHDLSVHEIELEIQNRELREVQRELEVSRDNYAEMYDFAPVAYLNFDDRHVIKAVNLAAVSFFKKDRGYLIGMDFGIFLEPESAYCFREHLQACRELGERRSVRLRIRTGSSSWVPTLVTTVFNDRLKAKNGVFFATLHDLTDETKSEELQRHYAEDLEKQVTERTAALREMNAEMEMFSTSVAHDIRAPLRVIKGYAEVLLEEKFEALGAEAVEYITRIARSAGRLDHLLYDLLQYSRVSRGHLELHPVALVSLLREVIEDQLQAADRTPAEIHLLGANESVLAQISVLRQVLVNLLENARKFVRPGVAPVIFVRSESTDTRVRILVADNGIGIDPQFHGKIFSIFERLNGEKYPGTGIGLAVARRAIERMGGRIGVEPNQYGGSTFWIELRKTDPSGADAALSHS